MADNDRKRSGQLNFNTLSNLFREYTRNSNPQTNNLLRLPSISYSNDNLENLRRDIFDSNIDDENEEFSDIIKEKLDEIKTKSISYFYEDINKINKNFENFKDKILAFIDSKEKKILKVSEYGRSSKGILKYATHNIFKKIYNTIKICDNIINNIEQNFKLLNTFFEQNIMINNPKQTEDFLMTNYKLIEKCSIVNKFDFTELDTIRLYKIDYYNYYIKYLSQKKIEDEGIAKNYSLTKNDLQNGIRFILENFSNLEKLKLEGIKNNEFWSILQNIDINVKNNNNQFNLTTLDLKNFGSIDIKIDCSKLNIIKKLKIQNGAYINVSTVTKLFIENNKNLTSLSLDYVNITDLGFKHLILSLKKNPAFKNNLEYLSLEGNRITEVDYAKLHKKNNNNKTNNNKNNNDNNDDNNNIVVTVLFQKLKTLNLRQNGIYNFDINFFNALPELKFLDLTSNKIPTGLFMKEAKKEIEGKKDELKEEFKRKLILMNDNMFITNVKDNNKIYIDYLNETFPSFDYEIKNLYLNFAYDRENEFNLGNLKISTDVVISLINLDLSFCAINTDTLVNFFKNNPKFLSLKSLNLSYNNIKGDFFEKIMPNEEICFDNINCIDLSENDFVCDSLEKIKSLTQFIEKNQNLEKMNVYNARFVTDLVDYIREKNSRNEKFKEVFRDLKASLDENKRDFKFFTNEAHAGLIQKEFRSLFVFPEVK